MVYITYRLIQDIERLNSENTALKTGRSGDSPMIAPNSGLHPAKLVEHPRLLNTSMSLIARSPLTLSQVPYPIGQDPVSGHAPLHSLFGPPCPPLERSKISRRQIPQYFINRHNSGSNALLHQRLYEIPILRLISLSFCWLPSLPSFCFRWAMMLYAYYQFGDLPQ
jgi:hypothetical protein